MIKIMIAILVSHGVSYAAPIKLEAKGGSVETLAIGKPSFIKIRGEGSAPKGSVVVNDQLAKGEFEFDVSSIDTGITLRNEHMRDNYLHVKKYPKAKLEIADLKLEKDWAMDKSQISNRDFKGKLTLHGETRDVSGQFSLGAKRDLEAKFKIKLSDYKIDIPEYMGVKVADEVEVKVKIAELKSP